MPSKHDSSDCADYVPALCTHRPSLLPIERYDELFGQEKKEFIFFFFWKNRKSYLLKEGEVVTRFPNLNDGCLGSYSDEGRSKKRYAMKNALTVNHRKAEYNL
ncbi:hypothetical protein POVCU2_0098010 [Plasmodium ovale curtisi]|uniref:Uncharacterized protein n=1 Tax=Plasmodium ovale curtisi TaxID=864141 RepID=A0A1A8X8V0_PLAOA|nr:hypothetical protein POVCU2_0098010 [Plasmodium ovale curtisi]SBT01671.1 hypothetical protein POVCU1_068650 [Plasmodium ovale curtisi]